jgi:hypothetical protein
MRVRGSGGGPAASIRVRTISSVSPGNIGGLRICPMCSSPKLKLSGDRATPIGRTGRKLIRKSISKFNRAKPNPKGIARRGKRRKRDHPKAAATATQRNPAPKSTTSSNQSKSPNIQKSSRKFSLSQSSKKVKKAKTNSYLLNL